MRQPTPNAKTVIKGERVFLRPPMKRDAAEFMAVNRRSASFNRGLASPPTRLDQFEAFLIRNKTSRRSGLLDLPYGRHAIMGSFALSQIFRGGFLSAYLGIRLARSSRDRVT